MKVSDYIIDFLVKHGVKDCFMLVGGGSMHLNDSVGNHPDMHYVCCLHEQACAMAAESYARCKRDLGVAIVTTGPGVTNTVTAIGAAWIESTPLFVISGQVKRADSLENTGVRSMGVQELEVIPIVESISKYAVKLNDPLKVRYELEKCVAIARQGRPGPVLMDVPLDVQASFVDEENLEPYVGDYQKPIIKTETIAEVVELIRNAKRPVFYGGGGVYMADASAEFVQLAEKFNVPVMTTWNGIDIIWNEHPLYMGRPGAIGQRAANFIIQSCDLLVTFWTRLASLQTGFNYDDYARNAKLVMVDIDHAELDKEKLHPFLKVEGDVKDFIHHLLSENVDMPDHQAWIDACREVVSQFPNINDDWRKEKEPANSYLLVESQSKQMTADDVYCGGRAGTCVDTIIHAFQVKKGQRVIATKGLSSMGYGLPAAIGAAVAYPGKRVVINNGDGGFVMNIQELAVVKHLNLPIKIFVLNNHGYATIVSTQTNVFNEHFVGCNGDSNLALGDIKAVAEAYGIKTYSINKNDEIDAVVGEALAFDGPVLCDVNVSIRQVIQPRQASFKNEKGQMQSRSLEDMKPFIEKTTMKIILNKLLDERMGGVK